MRTRIAVFVVALLAFTTRLAAQAPVTWVNFYGQPSASVSEGGTGAVGMVETFDSGYAWLSNDLNPQPPAANKNACCAVVVTKVDSTRAVLFQKSFTTIQTGGGNPILLPLAILEGSGHALLTSTNIINNVWLVKFDSSGSLLWQQSFYQAGVSGFFSLGSSIATNGDNYVVAGSWAGPNASMNTGPWAALVGINGSTGAAQWAQYYPTDSSPTPTSAVSVVGTSDGGFAMAANYTESNNDLDYRLIKTDSAGVPAFDRTYHDAGHSWVPTSVIQMADGSYVLAGSSFGAGVSGNLVLHLHSDGTIDWQKVYLTTFNALKQVAETPDHNIVFGGADNTNAAIYKISATDGSLMWAKNFTSPGFNFTMYFAGVVAETDGSVTVAGNGANIPDTVIGDTLLHVGPNGEFTGCLYGEQTVTSSVTVSDRTMTAASVNSATVSLAAIGNLPPAGFNISLEDIGTQHSACTSVLPDGLTPAALGTDDHPTLNSNGNGVFDPGETIIVQPTWNNGTGSDLALSGDTPLFQDDDGVGQPFDLTADYGVIANGSSADCFDATGDCYQFNLNLAVPRPSMHWDVMFDETLNDHSAFRWTMHIGHSFADVADTFLFYKYIETVFHNAITAGCGGGNYCPSADTTRSQMAVFLLKGEHGGTYTPPTCSSTDFADVPCPGGANVDWINQLHAEGITGGCGGGNYCPSDPVTRSQMAVFLLKAEHGGSYLPPICATTVFTDVPCPNGTNVNWINQLNAEGITGGCGGGNYCPSDSVTRGQMGVFLSKTFQLLLNAILP
jgi:hypothetical protein